MTVAFILFVELNSKIYVDAKRFREQKIEYFFIKKFYSQHLSQYLKDALQAFLDKFSTDRKRFTESG